MSESLRICIEVAVFSVIVFYATSRLNRPYPYNSVILDNTQGLSLLVFIPTFLYALAKGIWLL